jgi:hypothetical protein
MDALQRRLSDITASVEEKRRIHDELDKQREDLKQVRQRTTYCT